MTAIKTTERGATGTSSISSGHQEARIERTILVATNDFTSAVSNGVAELMRRCGFSRERATALLLRELRRGDSLPSDNQVRFSSPFLFGCNMRKDYPRDL